MVKEKVVLVGEEMPYTEEVPNVTEEVMVVYGCHVH